MTPAPGAPPTSGVRGLRWWLGAILLLAFSLRLAWRLHLGRADFWRTGYTFLYAMAQRLVAGHGLSLPEQPGAWWGDGGWAQRQPVYPLFLALTALFGHDWLLIVVPQALFGALTVACGFWLGRRWFGAPSGLIAAAWAAVYPYYVEHDTVLQDTSMVTAGGALAVCGLLRARVSPRAWVWLAAGALAGLAVLIRATLLPFSVGAVVWIALVGEGPGRLRLARAAVVGLAATLVVGAWVARNEIRVGRPVLSSEFGQLLYAGNSPQTFSYYPRGSIDDSARAAAAAVGLADRQRLASLPDREMGRNDYYARRALDWIARHPAETAIGVVRKELTGFSWVFSPQKDVRTQAIYFVSYAPILLLGLAGMVMARAGWREHSLVWLQFLGFVAVTAVFWAHTSHRSVLDIYLMVFAAPVILRIAASLSARLHAARRPVGLPAAESDASVNFS